MRPCYFLTLFLCISFLISSCTTLPPRPITTENLCAIFQEKHDWYIASREVFKKWGIPIYIQMAIMHQESSFIADAQPKGHLFFGLIPWFSASSAYGYPQAKDETWEMYQKKSGNTHGQRDNFADACDFIGWYSAISHQKLGITKSDTKNLYLAYHEGHNGFLNHSYLQKPWLINIADNVSKRAKIFEKQIKSCQL
jgi:hypothetical protein